MLHHQLNLRMAEYSPLYRQGRHYDPQSRISLVLCGAVAEETRNASATAVAGDIIFKSSRVEHEDRFGPEGAVIASTVIGDDFDFADALDGVWRIERSRRGLSESIAMVEALLAKDSVGAATVAASLLAHLDDEPTQRSRPPHWLRHLKDELEETGFADINVADRAKAAGVHPVSVSRMFKSAYGASITEHAQFHGVRRALKTLADTEISLASVAQLAGFYDQSHMSRVFRRTLGVTPGAIRTLARLARRRAC